MTLLPLHSHHMSKCWNKTLFGFELNCATKEKYSAKDHNVDKYNRAFNNCNFLQKNVIEQTTPRLIRSIEVT